MATLLTIGDFSRMTHLSIKALRHYHDVGVLEPAAVDPYSGYRSYDTSQVGAAQVIRRLRDLGMPLDGIKAVLSAPDVASRNAEISAHLARMEQQLAQVQSSVASLRALLSGPAALPSVQFRRIPAVTALAIAQVVTVDDFVAWMTGVVADLSGALAAGSFLQAGCFGALYPGDFFELERAEVTVFLPIEPAAVSPAGRQHDLGRATVREIPAIDAAVAVHVGSIENVDRTYAALGEAVAERVIGVDGPIREYYPTGLADSEESSHRTEICWPVFHTAVPLRRSRNGSP
ncbi:MAG TPA: MerR family transcriptional regulator [Trebonia sp.]|nr:MerR family transcriptional regulator [Trebonia sp.]